MKAIETEYKSYKFRSRLEARWVVFFDELGVDWEYERQGYEVNGLWQKYYLPDFWLPDFKLHLEIKPKSELVPLLESVSVLDAAVSSNPENLAYVLSQSGNAAAIAYGDPKDYVTHIYILNDSDTDFYIDYRFVQCERCGVVQFMQNRAFLYPTRTGYCFLSDDTLDIRKAACAARQARFEHRRVHLRACSRHPNTARFQ